MTLPFACAVRAYRPTDSGYVVATWTESLIPTPVPLERAKPLIHARIDRLLRDALTVVAVHPDDEDTIMGWACGEVVRDVGVLHAVYVRRGRRRAGLGRALVASLAADLGRPVIEASCRLTREFRPFADAYGLSYNPYSLEPAA